MISLIVTLVILAVCLYVLEGFGVLTTPAWGHHGAFR